MSPKANRKPTKRQKQTFGGRATAIGVGYEAQVAACIASKMLAGDCCVVWDGINGGDIGAITMQDAEPVDDVVVTLRADPLAKMFVSAKHRVGTIALTPKSPAFCEVIGSFVRQFDKLSNVQRRASRFMWAVPSSAGTAMTQDLRKALDNFRLDAPDDLTDFLRRRSTKEQKSIKAFIEQVRREWKAISKEESNETELVEFIRMTHVTVFDFGTGFHHERASEEAIRTLLVGKPSESKRIWGKLELHFNQANRQGLRTTDTSLRRYLVSEGISLKPAPEYEDDVEVLQRLTVRNLERLKDHTLLRFKNTEIHIARTDELDALTAAALRGHLLVTGEPGCGKSGLVHPLAEALSRTGVPVVLLLAEDIYSRDWKGAANLPELKHPLDDVLSRWPSGTHGVLLTDALDAVRDIDNQRLLRRLLQDVREGTSGWTVVASVREFDLKHGREWRESFPGHGVAAHSSNELAGTSHFHVTGLQETQLDQLVANVGEMAPFITSARSNPRAAGIHKSPFFLRLAAELLKNDVSAARLADWSSPAILLRKFWKARVLDGAGASHRKVAMQSICRRMTEVRSMSLSTQEVTLGASEYDAIDELRSRGILQSPILKHGSPTGEDQLRFSHHLLHDYAIARSLIPSGSERFSAYASQNPLLPIFYRQSFIFALEELWDGPDGRDGFWTCAFKMEGLSQLHGISRILAPILAARRVDTFADLTPLFTAVKRAEDSDSIAEKALRHMASGLQDADAESVKAGAEAWCLFAAKLSEILPHRPSLESPLVHILAQLNKFCSAFGHAELRELNSAAQGLLLHHVTKEVANGWRYSSSTAIESLCRTFSISPSDTESTLLLLLTPERLAKFPHDDLFDFANELSRLGDEGELVILRLFEAVFETEPEPGDWHNFGGSIMPMRIQNSDEWNTIRYSLSEYYQSRSGHSAALMTDIACIAWNAAMRRRNERRDSSGDVIATIMFRGFECEIFQDYGHIWRREHDHDESNMLFHFETLLDEWASTGDEERLDIALNHFATRNRTSLMWTVFMETGAKYPSTLGWKIAPVLEESLFLTHLDYSYAGTLLFGALHKSGSNIQREKLEKLLLELPRNATYARDEYRELMPMRIEYAQNKMLGTLEEHSIVLSAVRMLRIQRMDGAALPINRKREHSGAEFTRIEEDELLERRGIKLSDPVNAQLFQLREALKGFRENDNNFTEVIEQSWDTIGKCERILRQCRREHQEMASELWGHLVGACESIARRSSWDSCDTRWRTVRRILLKASTDVSPEASNDDDGNDECSSWGWPAPRLDAARGLLFLIYRLGRSDAKTKTALLRLCRDASHPLRFRMGDVVHVLEKAAPDLMWQLFDRFVRYEQKFSVLEAIVLSLGRLIGRFETEVELRLSRIAKRAIKAPDEHDIHEQLANVHLFHFLRTCDVESKKYITTLIAECDKPRANKALSAQLHDCRKGGWLTAGDAVDIVEYEELVRKRTWSFFETLLNSAQNKLQQHRQRWQQLHSAGQLEGEEMKVTKEAIDLTYRLVDRIAQQVYFASGALAAKNNKDEDLLTEPQKKRFWHESASIFRALSSEVHPRTAHQIVEALYHLLPCAPHDVFLIAAGAITASSTAGYQHESIAVGDVVKLIQRALADHREIFRGNGDDESECLVVLLKVLDIFVEAGWPKARQLTHRLEEIHR